MIDIDNCFVEETESGYKVTANEGFLIYRKDRMKAFEDYNLLREDHPRKYPKRNIKTFFRFSHSVYLPSNNDGANYATITESEAEALENL